MLDRVEKQGPVPDDAAAKRAVIAEGAETAIDPKVVQYLTRLSPADKRSRADTHLWGESAEGTTHGFGRLARSAAKRRLDELTVRALRRKGVEGIKLDPQ